MNQPRLGFPPSFMALFALGLAAAVVPFVHVLGDLYNVWNLKPEYSHGFIIPIVATFLIWRQREELRRLPFTGSWSALVLILAGLGLNLVGELTTMQTLEHYAFLLVIYGLVLALTGPTVFRRMWAPMAMLVFALPLPSLFDNALSLQLQLLSSQLGVWIIRAAGVTVLLEGNIIDLGSYQLEVAQACSGLRYLFPLMTLALIVAYLFRGAMWKRALIFLSSIPITVVMNSVRIGFIGITVDRWGPTMAEGVLHDFEGWLVFMLSSGLLLLVASWMARIGPEKTTLGQAFNLHAPAQRTGESASQQASQTVPRSFVTALVLVLLAAALDIFVPTQVAVAPTLTRAGFAEFPTRIGEWQGQRDTLQPVYLDSLQLDDYALINYRSPDSLPVNFYAAWYGTQDANRHVHSPRDCIPGGGWEVQKLEQRMFPSIAGESSFPINRAVIQLGSTRQVVYFWYQERGRHLTNDYLAKWYLFWDALTRRRTDGALVRFVAPIPAGGDESAADRTILALANKIVPALNRYIPN
jgi:exosortase D (VPLPA-CTERM-specific)